MRSAPPPGPPWDLSVETAPLAFVDLEMTGLADHDHVIEVCIERVEGGRVTGRLCSLVRPRDLALDAPVGNQHIHGITGAELADAPTFELLAPKIIELLSGAVFVAHAARFDVAFLRAEMQRAGLDFDVEAPLDTLALSRRAFALPSHSLAELTRAFDLEPGRAHRADDDVRKLRAVFERAVAALRPASVRDLFHVRIGERMARPDVLAVAREALRLGVPAYVVYRPSGKPPGELLFVVTRIDAEEVEPDKSQPAERSRLDPPAVFGYLLPGRGQRALRADRILSISLERDARALPAPAHRQGPST